MKTNKSDVQALKAKHRLELVMQAAGEKFVVDKNNPDLWISLTTPCLVVNVRKQLYELKKPGLDQQSGDVLSWLRWHYGWSFGMAVQYLQKLTPMIKHEDQPTPAEIKPATVLDNLDGPKPLDRFQEKALAIGGEKMRPFLDCSFWDLKENTYEVRIEPVCAPWVTECELCEKPIHWPQEQPGRVAYGTVGYRLEHLGSIPIVAYLIMQRDEPDAPFVEDGVVCAACAWEEYNFQKALELCRQSAWKREVQLEDAND